MTAIWWGITAGLILITAAVLVPRTADMGFVDWLHRPGVVLAAVTVSGAQCLTPAPAVGDCSAARQVGAAVAGAGALYLPAEHTTPTVDQAAVSC